MKKEKNKINSLIEYQKLCKKTAKKFKSREKEILTWGLGIAGEAGDVASCIKKTFAHNNDQREGIKENIGDTLWYAAMICNFFNWQLNDILDENTKKLLKRYPKGFNIKKAKRKGKRIDWNNAAAITPGRYIGEAAITPRRYIGEAAINHRFKK